MAKRGRRNSIRKVADGATQGGNNGSRFEILGNNNESGNLKGNNVIPQDSQVFKRSARASKVAILNRKRKENNAFPDSVAQISVQSRQQNHKEVKEASKGKSSNAPTRKHLASRAEAPIQKAHADIDHVSPLLDSRAHTVVCIGAQ